MAEAASGIKTLRSMFREMVRTGGYVWCGSQKALRGWECSVCGKPLTTRATVDLYRVMTPQGERRRHVCSGCERSL